MTQQTVHVETILLSVHTGTVTLTPVPEGDEEEPIEFMMEESDADAPTPVPRARSSREPGQRMYGTTNSITLLTIVPDFRRIAYVSADNMVADSWVSPEAIKQMLPVALASMRSKKAAGFQLVTRERRTESKFVVPLPSSYIRYQESLLIMLFQFFMIS